MESPPRPHDRSTAEPQAAPPQDLTLLLLQTELYWMDPEANRAAFEEIIRAEARPGQLVLLPEMFTTGFALDPPVSDTEIVGGVTHRWLRTMAEATGALIMGSVATRERDGRLYNRLLASCPERGLLPPYDKRHLFSYAGEPGRFTPGAPMAFTYEWQGWRIRPAICYDLRFPVWGRNVDLHYDLIVFVANWPAARGLAWQRLLPARAVENLAYVAGVNRVGRDGNGHDYAGASGVYDFDGRALAELGDGHGIRAVTLSAQALGAHRARFRAWQDADPFTLH